MHGKAHESRCAGNKKSSFHKLVLTGKMQAAKTSIRMKGDFSVFVINGHRS
jgi:hypothetical protein